MSTEADLTAVEAEPHEAPTAAIDNGESVDRGAPLEALEATPEQATAETEETGEVSPPIALAQAELPQVLEALLLASPTPLSMTQLKSVTEMSADALSGALEQLAERYREGTSGIVLVEAAGAWVLRTGERQKHFVRRLLGVKPQRLTRAALETLALVAYRQPITRPEVEDVRGVDCGAVLKALLERRMLKIIGKKEEPGRPLLYATSKEFLEVFGLKSLTSLPTLREFQELTEESRTIVENETGGEEPAGIEGIADLADGTFAARLEKNAVEDAEALADLEAAMEEAEARARKLSEQMAAPESTMLAAPDSTGESTREGSAASRVESRASNEEPEGAAGNG